MAQKYTFWHSPESIDLLETVIRDSKTVIMSSDTVLGLSAPLTPAGFESLNRIKGRSQKPYLIILPNKDALTHYCKLPLTPVVQQLIDRCWPGPLTLILPAKPTIDSCLTQTGSIAIRIPDHRPLLTLLSRVGGLFSTSANLSGGQIPSTIEQLDPLLIEQVALIVSDQQQVKIIPSTIIDCTRDQITVVREGAYPISMLEKITKTRIN